MPAISSAQQSIMGQAWAVRSGKMKISEVSPKWRKEIKDIAFGKKDKDGKMDKMTDKELLKFAKTKRSDLPERVKDGKPVKESENPLHIVPSKGEVNFEPKINAPGLKPITSFINPDSKKKETKGPSKNMSNLKDYRDWISQKNK
jgi:hypothetical protein